MVYVYSFFAKNSYTSMSFLRHFLAELIHCHMKESTRYYEEPYRNSPGRVSKNICIRKRPHFPT